MDIAALIELKTKLGKEADKWWPYLVSVKTPEERMKELQRKLLETWLEGHKVGCDETGAAAIRLIDGIGRIDGR